MLVKKYYNSLKFYLVKRIFGSKNIFWWKTKCPKMIWSTNLSSKKNKKLLDKHNFHFTYKVPPAVSDLFCNISNWKLNWGGPFKYHKLYNYTQVHILQPWKYFRKFLKSILYSERRLRFIRCTTLLFLKNLVYKNVKV